MEAGIELWKMTGFENWQTWFAVLKVQVLLMLARTDEALSTVDEQFARMDGNNENQFRSVLMAQKAVVLRAQGVEEAALDALFDEAAALAESQGAVAWSRWIADKRLAALAIDL
jgi:hypothetical protein